MIGFQAVRGGGLPGHRARHVRSDYQGAQQVSLPTFRELN